MTWFTLLGMACITYLNRFIFLAPGLSYRPGEKITRLLSYSSLAVLTAIWLPMVLQIDGQTGLTITGVDYLLGSLAAGVLTFLRLNGLLVVVISTVIFFSARYLVG